MAPHDSEKLREWFHRTRRDLPWRSHRDPYAVLVSEVMLQQTRVEAVLRYFTRWMERFPTLKDLADAPWETVVKMWEGLGYYARARRLQEAAKICVERFHSQLPREETLLRELPGFGPYTLAAVQAFAFEMRAAPVDGNVLRVWSRLEALEEPIDQSKAQKEIRNAILQWLPRHRPFEVAEGMIELGALVCLPGRPQCGSCPFQDSCKALRLEKTQELPRKRSRYKIISLECSAWLLERDGSLYLEKGSPNTVLGELWKLPTTSLSQSPQWGLKKSLDFGEKVRHSYTQYRVTLYPKRVLLESDPSELPSGSWCKAEELDHLAIASGHRTLVQRWKAFHADSFANSDTFGCSESTSIS